MTGGVGVCSGSGFSMYPVLSLGSHKPSSIVPVLLEKWYEYSSVSLKRWLVKVQASVPLLFTLYPRMLPSVRTPFFMKSSYGRYSRVVFFCASAMSALFVMRSCLTVAWIAFFC